MLTRRTPLSPMSRRSPLKQRKPLSRGRRARPTADVQRYWDSLPDACVVTGAPGAVLHHIMADAPGKRGRRDDMLVVRITPFLHNMGTDSVHLLGSEAAFNDLWRIDLVAIAVRNRDDWLARQ